VQLLKHSISGSCTCPTQDVVFPKIGTTNDLSSDLLKFDYNPPKRAICDFNY
jgi:hypothetical protein